MKTINISLATLGLFCLIGVASAVQTTTTTTESYTSDGGSVTTSKTLVVTEKRSDKEISKLLTEKIDGYLDDVAFTVQDGVVILSGKAKTMNEKTQAANLAESIPGVVTVNNLISIE